MRRITVLVLLLPVLGPLCASGMSTDGLASTPEVASISRVEKQVEIRNCGEGKACQLSLLITFPKDDGLPVAPMPIVLLFSGFQMPRSWYNSYAEQLASSGHYIVVQYETSSSIMKPLIPDQIEAQFIPQLLSFLAGEASDSASPLYNQADASRVGLMGHSRGAKLAALALASGVHLPQQQHQQQQHQQHHHSHDERLQHSAKLQQTEKRGNRLVQGDALKMPQAENRGHQPVEQGNGLLMKGGGLAERDGLLVQEEGLVPQLAAVLIDPVDSGSGSSPQDLQFPSAAQALAGQNRSAAIIGAGICSWCNPKDDGWRKFWPVLQSGWLQVVSAAGHLQFTDARGATAWAWDKFCGGGSLSHAEVQEFPVRAALAWFGLAFQGKPPTGYIDWSLKQQERASFEVKDARTLHAE